MERGTYVRMRNGIVALFLWSYENPVHRPGYHDRASVGVGIETWGANLNDLRPVSLGPVSRCCAARAVPQHSSKGELVNADRRG